NGARPFASGSVGWAVLQALALGFQVPQFDVEEVVLAQRECHLFGRPPQELQELLVGQQMPVALDDGQRGTALLLDGNPGWPRQPHAPAQAHDVTGTSPDDLRHPAGGHQLPVAPHERVQPIWKVRKQHRLRGAASWQIRCGQAGCRPDRRRVSTRLHQTILREPATSQGQGRRLKEGSAVEGDGRSRSIWSHSGYSCSILKSFLSRRQYLLPIWAETSLHRHFPPHLESSSLAATPKRGSTERTRRGYGGAPIDRKSTRLN